MKKLKNLSVAVFLMLMLCMSAYAGEIGIGKAPPPPPDSSSTSVTSEIQVGGDVHMQSSLSDSIGDIALNLLQTVLLVF